MKIFFNIILGIQLFVIANGQTIPNSGFENWTNQPGGYENPDNWGTINHLTFVVTLTATKATGVDKHSGTYALKLESKSLIQTAPGIAVTGTLNSNPNQTAIDFKGIPINFRPVGLSGWFKYTPAGTDTGSVEITLFKWNSSLQKRDEVGRGVFEIGHSVNAYTNFIAPIDYILSDVPDTAVIILLSGSDGNPTVGSKLFLDDFAYVTCSSVGISVTATEETAPGANDGSASANLTIGATPISYAWGITATTQTISGLTAGYYCVTVTDGSGCAVSGCDSVRTTSAVGIDDASELSFGIYPNPVSSDLHLTTTDNGSTFSLFDSKGRKCLETSLVSGVNTVNTSNLTEGIYFYFIRNENSGKTESARILISK